MLVQTKRSTIMLGIINIQTFIIAGTILILAPGSDTIYILSRSIAEGKKAGILSVLGIHSGLLIHIFAVSCGLALVLTRFPLIFSIIKDLGALYLFYLGIKFIAGRKFIFTQGSESYVPNHNKIYLQGLLTNLSNPKVIIFFLTFLPQFVNTKTTHVFFSFLTLGTIFLIIGFCWALCLVTLASFITKKLRGNSRTSLILNVIAGIVFIALGLFLFVR